MQKVGDFCDSGLMQRTKTIMRLLLFSARYSFAMQLQILSLKPHPLPDFMSHFKMVPLQKFTLSHKSAPLTGTLKFKSLKRSPLATQAAHQSPSPGCQNLVAHLNSGLLVQLWPGAPLLLQHIRDLMHMNVTCINCPPR